MLGTQAVRVLGPTDLPEVTALLARDPVGSVFVGARLREGGLAPLRLGGELWGYSEEGRLQSLCYAGANLVPVEATAPAVEAFADHAIRQGRRCSSIVGPARDVLALWSMLEERWGPAREVRPRQPVLLADSPPAVPPDPLVRPVRPDEVDVLLPASVQMFTEEVGVSPIGPDGGALYRARLAQLVDAGLALARIEDGDVVFKAEMGSVTAQACQVQGVWVRPDRRGEGLSVGGMAAVITYALAHVAPLVQLYVNDFNLRARAAYARVGMREVGTFATVLF